MSSAREQARETAPCMGKCKCSQDAADAASEVWEPLVKELHQVLAYYDRTSSLDPGARRSMAQQRANVLRRATEALG